MKKFVALFIAMLFSFGVMAQQNQTKTETAKFEVSMTCNKCKATIEKNIPFEKGVKDMNVDLEKKEVTVTFDPAKTSKSQIIKAFEKLKFTAKEVK